MNDLTYPPNPRALNKFNIDWRETYRVRFNGLVHMGLITCNADLDEEMFFLPCSGWTSVPSEFHTNEMATAMITCLTCAGIRCADGKLLW